MANLTGFSIQCFDNFVNKILEFNCSTLSVISVQLTSLRFGNPGSITGYIIKRYEIVATKRVTRNESKEKSNFYRSICSIKNYKNIIMFRVATNCFSLSPTSVRNLILVRSFDGSEMPVGCLAWTLNTCRASSINEKKDIQNDFSLISFFGYTSFFFSFRSSCVRVCWAMKILLIHFSSTSIFVFHYYFHCNSSCAHIWFGSKREWRDLKPNLLFLFLILLFGHSVPGLPALHWYINWMNYINTCCACLKTFGSSFRWSLRFAFSGVGLDMRGRTTFAALYYFGPGK